jgi:hypothetical protein
MLAYVAAVFVAVLLFVAVLPRMSYVSTEGFTEYIVYGPPWGWRQPRWRWSRPWFWRRYAPGPWWV